MRATTASARPAAGSEGHDAQVEVQALASSSLHHTTHLRDTNLTAATRDSGKADHEPTLRLRSFEQSQRIDVASNETHINNA